MLPRPLANPRRGYSLLQVMVTTAVIGVVIGLLLSGVQVVRHQAMRAHCSNNLQNCGLAFHHWKDVNDPKIFPTSSWVSELTRFTENSRDMFHCPLDELSWKLTDSQMYIRLFWNGTNPLVIYSDNWTQYNTTSGVNSSNPLLNAGIVQIAKDEAVGIRCRQSYSVAVPSSSSEGAWMAEFETTWATNNTGIGHALDWNDLFLLVEPQPNGSTKITYWASDPAGGVGGNESFDILDQNLNVIATNVQPKQFGYVPGNGRGISYGMNSRAHDLQLDYSRILLLEYKNTIARVVSPAPYNMNLADWPTNVSPRHVGTLNVLYADGHVESHTDSEVDPRIGSIASQMWTPATQ